MRCVVLLVILGVSCDKSSSSTETRLAAGSPSFVQGESGKASGSSGASSAGSDVRSNQSAGEAGEDATSEGGFAGTSSDPLNPLGGSPSAMGGNAGVPNAGSDDVVGGQGNAGEANIAGVGSGSSTGGVDSSYAGIGGVSGSGSYGGASSSAGSATVIAGQSGASAGTCGADAVWAVLGPFCTCGPCSGHPASDCVTLAGQSCLNASCQVDCTP